MGGGRCASWAATGPPELSVATGRTKTVVTAPDRPGPPRHPPRWPPPSVQEVEDRHGSAYKARRSNYIAGI